MPLNNVLRKDCKCKCHSDKTVKHIIACCFDCTKPHLCHCGNAAHTPHENGKDGCRRVMEVPPISIGDDMWLVDGYAITDYTLRNQRGYHAFECGCWSSWNDSKNSLDWD